jgi:hypothetical protein
MLKPKTIKGIKRQAGLPATEYGEIKKAVKITLTPTAITSSTAEAEAQNISRSELFEKYARNPLAYLEWVRSQIQTDVEWVVFWEAVEDSICLRHKQKLRKLNGLAVFRLLALEDIANGQKAVCEIREKSNVVVTVD